jgi:YfiH family protein
MPNVYCISAFDELPWLRHGFGTAHSTDWPPEPLASVKQIHSNHVIQVTEACSGRLAEADALVTNVPGANIGIRTADCVPILLADPEHRAVAAIHAGWRGTVDNIAGAAVRAMGTHYGSRPQALLAAIGPAIGFCCFEVGPEVAVQFAPVFPERTDLEEKVHIDLQEANRRLLTRAGVQAGHLYGCSRCTFCTAGEFHSWRRDHSPGRMVSVIGIRTGN